MSIQISVNQIEYSNISNGSILHIFGRDENGDPHQVDVSGFRPYFYAPMKQADTLPSIAGSHVDVEKTYFTIKGLRLRRIYTRHPGDVREIRSRYQHHEADIPFGSRFMLDYGIKSGIKVEKRQVDCGNIEPIDVNYEAKVCVADIECEDHRGFPEPERDAITAITAYDSFSKQYVTFLWSDINSYKVSVTHEVRCYKTEIELLQSFIQYMIDTDPDILTGWNFTEFDLPYIIKRMTTVGLDPMKMSRLPGKSGEKADK